MSGDHHCIWVADGTDPVWRLEVLLEPGDHETWLYRRDRGISRPRRQMIGVTVEGVPYLEPEGVLLYKAKATRAKDETDFRACAELMSAEARRWLREALRHAHPGHPWIDDLT